MVWTRGDNLVHGLTQFGLLIDSLFDFKEERWIHQCFARKRAGISRFLYVYVKILSRRRKESENKKKFLSSEWEGVKTRTSCS
jgi:hypothetical protein